MKPFPFRDYGTTPVRPDDRPAHPMTGKPVDEQLAAHPNEVPKLTYGQTAKARAVIEADRKRMAARRKRY